MKPGRRRAVVVRDVSTVGPPWTHSGVNISDLARLEQIRRLSFQYADLQHAPWPDSGPPRLTVKIKQGRLPRCGYKTCPQMVQTGGSSRLLPYAKEMLD